MEDLGLISETLQYLIFFSDGERREKGKTKKGLLENNKPRQFRFMSKRKIYSVFLKDNQRLHIQAYMT